VEVRHPNEIYFNGKYWDGLTFGLIRNEHHEKKT